MRIDLREPVTLQSAGAALSAFFRWWARELVSLLPRRSQDALFRAFAAPRLYLLDASWYLESADGSFSGAGVDASLPTPALRNALRREHGRLPRRPVVLELPRREVLVRTVRVPHAAAGRIGSLAALQAERLSPFKSRAIGFDYDVAGDKSDPEHLLVDIAVVPRATLLRYQEWAEALGLRVETFAVEDSPYRFGLSGRLGLSRQQLIDASLALAAVVFLALAVAVLGPTRQGELDDASAAVDRLAPAAAQAEAARDELARLRPVAAFLDSRLTAPQSLDVLEALTRIVPTSARVTDVSFSRGRVTILGFSPDPSEIPQALDRSGEFSAARMTGPVVMTYPGLKRFDVTAQITRKLPNRWVTRR